MLPEGPEEGDAMSRWRAALWPLLGLAGALAFAAALQPDRGDATQADEEARVPVEVATVRARALPGEVRAGGFLRAVDDVTVSAERAGRVVALPVPEGARVARGEVVARLDATIAEANLRRARAVHRETELSGAADAAEKARAAAALRVAEHELALHRPAAPVAGVVEVHHVEAGEYVRVGQPLVDVVDPDRLVLDADVDAEVVGRLETGKSIAVHGPGNGSRPARGTVTRVATRAGARTRRFRVEVTFAAEGTGLLPGMHAAAVFVLPPAGPALYLPKAAVRERQGERGVFRVVEGRARWTPVRVADVYPRPDLWRVRAGGVADGSTVVVAGFPGLRDGAAVDVAPAADGGERAP